MRLREIDAGGWARVLGVGLLTAALWTLVAMQDFGFTTPVVVLVGLALMVLVVAAVLVAWATSGGYRQRRVLRAWVRGADLAADVPVPVRIRYLRRANEGAGWFGWLGLVLVALNAWNGVWSVLHDDDPWSSVLPFAMTAIWGAVSVSTLVFVRRSLPRVRLLLAEAEQEQADSWFERRDESARDRDRP
jgi:hypothetical protein